MSDPTRPTARRRARATDERRHPMGASIVLAVAVVVLIIVLALAGGSQ